MAEETKGMDSLSVDDPVLVDSALQFLNDWYGYAVLNGRMLERIGVNKDLITALPEVHVYPYAGNPITTPDDARKEFKERLPVFVGGRVNEHYFRKWLGRDVNRLTYGQGTKLAKWGNRNGNARKVDIENVCARAVLMADVHFLPSGAAGEGGSAPSHSAQRQPLPLLRVVHAFGLNFESGETRDNRHVHEQSVTDAREFIDKTNGEMWAAVLRAAVEGVPDKIPVHVRIPAIGLGEYKRELRTELTVERLIQSYVNTLRKEVQNARVKRQNLSASLCIFGDLYSALQRAGVAEDAPGSGFKVLEGCNLFDVPEEPTIEVNEKTMRAVDVGEGNLEMLAVVNAWDTNSWIGNGMVRDHTVDGFFVADANNMNEKLQNTSFLMNVAMINGDLGQIKVHAQERITGNGGQGMSDSSESAKSDDAEDDLPPPPPPKEPITVEQALRAVLEMYYDISKDDVDTLFRIIEGAKNDDGCILHELLNDILTGVGRFTMGDRKHGSAKWLDVFSHLAQRMMQDPKSFNETTCPMMVARFIGCNAEDEERAANMLRESVFRVIVKDVGYDELVGLDMDFKNAYQDIAAQRLLLDQLYQAIDDTSGEDSAPTDGEA